MNVTQRFITAATTALLCATTPASAEVTDVAANGFTSENSLRIDAPAERVFAMLIQPARWWSSDHTFSRDAANLTLEAKAGGCFCEKLPGGGAVLHLLVVNVDPGKLLRLRGALGPFQGAGVDGAMSWMLKPAASGTDLTLTYAIGGYRKDGFEQISKAADAMLAEQLARLKHAIETESPASAPKAHRTERP